MSERTLSRYLTVMKDVDLDKDSQPVSVGYSSRKVILIKYLCSSDFYFGLSPMEVRKLAFTYATYIKCKMQNSRKSSRKKESSIPLLKKTGLGLSSRVPLYL